MFVPALHWTEPKFLGVEGIRIGRKASGGHSQLGEKDQHVESFPKMNQGEMILHVLSLSFPPCKHS